MPVLHEHSAGHHDDARASEAMTTTTQAAADNICRVESPPGAAKTSRQRSDAAHQPAINCHKENNATKFENLPVNVSARARITRQTLESSRSSAWQNAGVVTAAAAVTDTDTDTVEQETTAVLVSICCPR